MFQREYVRNIFFSAEMIYSLLIENTFFHAYPKAGTIQIVVKQKEEN